MAKKNPELVLPPDPIFSYLERTFRHLRDSPESLRFSQYHISHNGLLSALFSQIIGPNTIIFTVTPRSHSSLGTEYHLSACAARGTKNLAAEKSSPDPSIIDVLNLLTSMEIQVKQKMAAYARA